MGSFDFGPVELYLLGLGEQGLAPRALKSLSSLTERGVVRLLDFVLIVKSPEGEVAVVELGDDGAGDGLDELELVALGVAGEEDIEDLAEAIPPGSAAALVALELSWAKEMAAAVAESGAEVLSVERIPAPVVNALVDALDREN